MKDKVTYVGNGKIVDANGAIHNAPEILKQTRHENFEKMEVMSMVSMIDHIGNKKMKVVSYIMDHLTYSTNTLIITQRELAKALGFSITTVEATIKALKKAKIIKARTGAIMLSPHLFMKGRPKHYGYLLVKFSQFGANVHKNSHKRSRSRNNVNNSYKSKSLHENRRQSNMIKLGKNKKPVKTD